MTDERRLTLTDILRRNAERWPDRLAFSFLADGELEAARLTCAELDRRARSIGALLQEQGARGRRVLLVFEAGLEFVTSFFGCLYAGAVAVPSPPPHPARLARTLPRVQTIAADSGPAVALTTSDVYDTLSRASADAPELLDAIRWVKVDEPGADASGAWRDPAGSPEDLAYLQYTSGSTSAPKGVMVTHSCLAHQSEHLGRAYGYTRESVSATWMPNFHDYGLVEGIVHPALSGVPAYLFSPLAFVQRPARWLEVVTRYGVTHSSGPDFAYELCVRKVTDAERATLDLSSWRAAGNAAEPVHRETLERFREKFAPRGFRWESFYPSFGLAEATLMVSAGGAAGRHAPLFITADAAALEQERRVVEVEPDAPGARSLVGCGRPILDTEVAVVDPETRRRRAPDEIGEIWVRCEGLARGYWRRPEETEAKFNARIADTGEGPYMRTGDLGFVLRGEVFVSGRVKDIIIIRGQNYYPQDIEWTVEHSHPSLRPGCCAAFAVEVGREERLVVVQEVRRELARADGGEVLRAVREAVAERHELEPAAVVLIKSGSVHKTSSGKIQRHANRRDFLDGSLEVVAEWRARDAEQVGPRAAERVAARAAAESAAPEPGGAAPRQTADAVRDWLLEKVAALTGIPAEEVDAGQPFRHLGFDSARVVGLVGDLSAWLGRRLPPSFLWDYPTVEAAVRALVPGPAGAAARPAGVERAGATAAPAHEPVAIVGMGCRFPGAESVEDFWRLLVDGVDAVGEVPPGRWGARADGGAAALRRGGFLKNVAGFDAHFFGISPREAAQIDPQQRLLHEVAWEALEDAGCAPDRLGGSPTGVFVGISQSDYARLQLDAAGAPDAYAGTGTALSIAANRLSYLLDLRGPSVAVDTACSSSLVAVHMACQSLRSGESRMAIAGGVNLLLKPELTEALARAGMMSADGRCKTFDAAADGYVRAEGCGVVVLKRLSDALAEGDRVVALIRGSAVNQDGRSNGLTAPNGPAQRALVRRALEAAGVAPAEVGYVEAHGTGTPLGDPVEFDALGATLGEGRARGERCLVGSVKTNLGHLEAAAGVAGLVKTALCLERELVPPHLHLRTLNPRLSVEESPLEVVTRGREWRRGARPRFAGVSSFGFGGTNAHVVLEEAPARAPAPAAAERTTHLLALSAQSEEALRELAGRYAEHLARRAEQPLPDVCFTANAGRAHFSHRAAAVLETREGLAESLRACAGGGAAAGLRRGRAPNRRRPKIALLFTGQGAQYVGMGRGLYETQPAFRRALDACDEILRPRLERPLLSVLYGEGEAASPLLDETAYAQPALFAVGHALAELWRAWGVEPDFVCGHSVGEYAAACAAGALSFEEGLLLVAERARLMQALPRAGEMAVALTDAARVAAALAPFAGRVAVAAANGPSNTVVSGEREAVRELRRALEAGGVTTRPLKVSHAFHSPLVEPALDEFAGALRRVSFRPLSLPLVSGLTGAALEAGELTDADFWLRHARQTVLFDACVRTLAARGCDVFVEAGPDAPLLSMARRCVGGGDNLWLPSLRRGRGDWGVLLDSLSALYVRGARVDWEGFDRDYARRRVPLPTYPFERKSYWLKPSPREGGDSAHEAEGAPRARAARGPEPHAPGTPKGDGTHMNEEQSRPSNGAARPADAERRKEAILGALCRITGGLLEIAPESLDAHASFLEMGADSIVLSEAVRVIEDTFSLKISIRQLFENFTTLDALADHIALNATPEATAAAAPPSHFAATPARDRQDLDAPALRDPGAASFQAGDAHGRPPADRPAARGLDAPAALALPPERVNGAGAPADSLERIMSQQLTLLSQFSDLMRQQLSTLGQPHAPAPPVLAASSDAQALTDDARRPAPAPQPRPQSPTNGKNGDAPYVPHRPIRPGAVGGFSERQQRHLAALVERFTRRTAESKRMAERFRPALADSRAVVGFRLSIKEMLYPIVGAGGDGARLRDVDGNEYLDITMGFGVHLFGHRPPFVTEAIEEQLRRGIELGPRPALAGEVAALVCELTGMERATFCNSGTEAVMTALRLARAKTGRTKVALFAGSYHGHSDGTLARAAHGGGGDPRSVPLAPGIPPHVVEDVLVLDYGSPRSLEALRAHGDELAAVIVEPVQSRRPELQPREFLRELRDWTRRAGVVLIFDEMVTGFRVHPGGAQALFGVEADLATYGKIAGGGLPLGIVAGRAPFMDGIDGGLWQYGDSSYPRAETTYFGGTFCQHPLAMAAARAVLTRLKERGPALQEELSARTSRFAASLNDHFEREEAPLRVNHFGSLFRFGYTGNLDLLFYHLLVKGVFVWEWRNCFLSTAHTDEDLARVARAVTESVAEMREGGFIPPKSDGPPGGGRHAEGARGAACAVEPGASLAPKACAAPANGAAATAPAESLTSAGESLTSTSTGKFLTSAGESLTSTSSGESLTSSGESPASPAGSLASPAGSLASSAESLTDGHAAGRRALGFWGRSEAKPALVGGARAAAVVEERAGAAGNDAPPRAAKGVELGLYYFGKYEAAFDAHKYDLLIEGARFADRRGFDALWIPERHFHPFGGFSPNPSVLAAALARETERIGLRAGSVVLPLHHPVRVAEEWAVVDNLSRGRVGVSFASGWHPDDFVFAPEAYGNHRELMFERIEEVRRLWRGGRLRVRGGAGNELDVRLFPQPMQRELPVWVTVVNNPETYRRAGAIGARVLTNLMGQTVEDLARNVALYRAALAGQGHDPSLGHVSVLLHTFVGDSAEEARERARRPFCDYLRSSLDLLQNLVRSQGLGIDFKRLSEDDLDYILSSAYERYVRTSALIGTPETCEAVVAALSRVGVDEVACFIDFGVEAGAVLDSLPHLDALRGRCQTRPGDEPRAAAYVLASARAAEVVRRVPLTDAQKQLRVLAQMGDDASRAYNETLCLRLRGTLDLAALRRAFGLVVGRHESLRSTIDDGGEEMLVHPPPASFELPLVDFSDAGDAGERESAAARWLGEEGRHTFDLRAGPLVRLHVLRLEDRHHLLALNVHHIVCDGWSVGVMLEEACCAYEAELGGRRWEADAPAQFGEYAARLRLPESLAKKEADEGYWVERLAGGPARTDLPADRPRPPRATYNGARIGATFDRRLCEDLRLLGRRHGCTPFVTLLAGYLALLHRLTGQAEVVVGVPVAGRPRGEDRRLVGYCTRPVPVTSSAPDDPTFSELLTRVRGALLEAREHEDYSPADLVMKLGLPRDAGRFPLFSSTFNMEPLGLPPLPGLEVEWVSFPVGYSKFDCGVSLLERGGELLLECDFNTDLFDRATVARMLGRFRVLLEGAARDPARRLSELPVMTEAERRQVLGGWREGAGEARSFRCVHAELEEVARRHGSRVAVARGGEELTYAELNARANQLARHLRSFGVGPGVAVGVCAERSTEMVVALLGVLKAGGAYLPLDPEQPRERLAFMLEDAPAPALLTQSALAEKFSDYWGHTVRLDADRGAVAPESDADGAAEVGAENLAYIIYTSGSTGRPKGVAVPHRAVHNLVVGTSYVKLDESDVVAQVSNCAFDAATFEIWGALLAGARLQLVDKDVTLSPAALAAQLEAHGVTVMFLTTALFNLVAAEAPAAFRRLRVLLFGGEAVEVRWVREVLEKGRPGRLLHVYGPTETTTFATWHEVESLPEPAHTVPVGRPLTGVQTYVLDARLRPVPVGVTGELYVGGAGLARGYHERPALTAERFVPHPFSEEAGARLYRTGDLARFLPGGAVEFVGRVDDQVKLRGFRVEPGEVEAALSAHPKVARAAVVCRADAAGERSLAAYVVAGRGETCGAAELRRHLRERLPEYMMPSAFVTLEALPLTANGKLDRRRLPAPAEGRGGAEADFVAPRSAVERKLAEFWSEVLGVQSVGVEDDFFALGGHSLRATQVISRVRDFYGVEVPIHDFFDAPTVAALARRVEQRGAARADAS